MPGTEICIGLHVQACSTHTTASHVPAPTGASHSLMLAIVSGTLHTTQRPQWLPDTRATDHRDAAA